MNNPINDDELKIAAGGARVTFGDAPIIFGSPGRGTISTAPFRPGTGTTHEIPNYVPGTLKITPA
jgi:hypothetical protein